MVKCGLKVWVMASLPLLAQGAIAADGADLQAQPQGPASGQMVKSDALEEIVVTAEKRPEDLQKAPVAITVIPGQQLVDMGFQDIRDATVLFPSARFTQIASTTHLYIRGIGAEQDRANIDPLVTMTQDDINVPREITGNNLFDIQSVDVLPGPQSTLYGNSAAGGAVNIVNNRPTTDGYERSVSYEAGNYALRHVTAVENIPVNDQLAVRAAVDYAGHNAYMEGGSGVEDQFGGRLSALYKPNDFFSAYVWGQYNNTGGSPPNTTVTTGNEIFAVPSNPWNDNSCAPSGVGIPLGANPSCDPFYTKPASQRSNSTTLASDLQWRFDGFSLDMKPSYLFDDQHILQYFGPFPNDQAIWNRQISDELKAVSDPGGPLTWLAGLFWSKDRQYQFFNLNSSAGNPELWNDETTYAAYGQVTYAVLDWLRATGGLRYSSNEKEGRGCNCTAGGGEGIYFTSDHTTPRVDWKAGLDADVGKHSLVYFTVQTGYTNGTYQYYNTSGLLGPANAGPAPLVQPSTLLAYTAGSKNRFFDNRLEINDEVYYYDYKNLLISAFDSNPTTFGNQFYNAKKTENLGDELDIKYLISSNDQAHLNLGLLRARAVDFLVGNPPVNYDGLELISSPEVTLNVGLQHIFDLGSGASIVFNGDTHYENGFWATFNHALGSQQKAFTDSDLRLTFNSANGIWHVALWGKNVENKPVLGNGAIVGAGSIQDVTLLWPPRTFGVRVSASLGKPRAQ